MTKADTSKRTSTSTARGRGTYAPQACSICRGKKTKCDGIKPICGPCLSTGRHEECSWGRESIRRPRTEAHFEAMRKRADALAEYANLLESILEKCRREHGGGLDNGQSYLQLRPVDADGMILPDDVDYNYDYDDQTAEDINPTRELCVPTQNLKLEEGNLLLHGNTAIFRFAPGTPVYPSESRFPAIAENPRASYVLLVDGADGAYYNPDFDWSRYLPTAVPITRREHDRLLDLVFKFFTSWCLRIVPALFLRDMVRALSVPRSQTPPKTPHYSPMLHNALVALGTAFSDDPRIRDIKSRQYFAAAAKSYIESECQHPNISVVHALSIIGSFHSSLGDQTLGYLYFGMSARISQACESLSSILASISFGIHIYVSIRGSSHEHDMVDRNWAHWTIFAQDVCWSLYVGRDFCVSAPSVSKRIPIPFVDSDFDQLPWHYVPANIPPQPNFLSRTFAATCELLMIARRIMDVVNGLNGAATRQEVNDELISNIDLQLNTWKGNLSPDVDITLKTRQTATPHRIMMHCTYWWLFILLHRPFYHRRPRPVHSSDKDIDHVKLCKRSADNIMELLATWRSLYTLRYAPITLVQTIFSAGTVFHLVAVQSASGMRVAQESLKYSLFHAQLCVQYLLEIGKSWQCSTNIAKILRHLFQEQLKPLLDRRAIQQADVAMRDGFDPAVIPPPDTSSGLQATSRRRKSSSTRKQGQLSSPADLLRSYPKQRHRAGSSNQQNHIPPPQAVQQPSMPEDPFSFNDERWTFESDAGTPLSDGASNLVDHPVFPNIFGMESSRPMAMLGGETLPNAPFLPTFGSMDDNITFFQDSSILDGTAEAAIPESELAFLAQLWDQHFA